MSDLVSTDETGEGRPGASFKVDVQARSAAKEPAEAGAAGERRSTASRVVDVRLRAHESPGVRCGKRSTNRIISERDRIGRRVRERKACRLAANIRSASDSKIRKPCTPTRKAAAGHTEKKPGRQLSSTPRSTRRRRKNPTFFAFPEHCSTSTKAIFGDKQVADPVLDEPRRFQVRSAIRPANWLPVPKPRRDGMGK